MKKSELSFKCVLPTPQHAKLILDKIKAIGIYNDGIVQARIKESGKTAAFMSICNRMRFTFGLSSVASFFCNWTEPLMSYEEALNLIESIEPDAPEFDIKPFDKVLWKQNPKIKSYNDTTWHLDFYADRINIDSFACIGNTSADCLLLCNADTLELNNSFDYPAGWWECENGKPVWRMKQK